MGEAMIGTIKTMIDVAKTRATNRLIYTYREYVTFKYGKKSDICVLTGDGKNFIRFDTTLTDGVLGLSHLKHMRRLVGDNVVRIHGLPREDEKPRRICLIPLPSGVKTIGLRKFLKFYKDEWRGSSQVGNLTAIIYQ